MMQCGTLVRSFSSICSSSLRGSSLRTPSPGAVSSHEPVVAQAVRSVTTDAQEPAAPPGDGAAEMQRRKLVNSLLYRSKQRGFLELDLLVGLWAQKHVPAMAMPALRAFAAVLDVDNPDLFKWLTGQEQPGQSVMGNPSFQAMQRDIMKQIQETRPQLSATQPGRTWVRGWDDWQKEQPQQPAQ